MVESQKLIKRQNRLSQEERAMSSNTVKMQELQCELNKMLMLVKTSDQGGATAGGIGSIQEYKQEEEDWNVWIERFGHYIIANGIGEERKKSTLLSMMGTKTYALLRDLCSLDTPASKSYEELLRILKDHFQPEYNTISERYRFKECKQAEGEDIRQFVARIKKASTNCSFGATLEDCLRDQFVFGLHSTTMRKRILRETDYTFAKAREIALSFEATT